MSTPHSTLVSEILAEYNARPEANAGPPTPKEAHARMIQLVNAANGLRYEVARFGDIERQLKAVHEKMEPLVLKAKELNDLICERVSQASQPWANSCIHESEELMQKVQRLEHENAALRGDKKILDWMHKNVHAIQFKYKPDVLSMDVRAIVSDKIAKEALSAAKESHGR